MAGAKGRSGGPRPNTGGTRDGAGRKPRNAANHLRLLLKDAPDVAGMRGLMVARENGFVIDLQDPRLPEEYFRDAWVCLYQDTEGEWHSVLSADEVGVKGVPHVPSGVYLRVFHDGRMQSFAGWPEE